MTYQIIDEPQSRPALEMIIINPLAILFAAMIVPLFWNPPLQGRLWMPFLWLAINSYALGSATFRKEMLSIVIGLALVVLILFLTGLLITSDVIPFSPEQLGTVSPHLRNRIAILSPLPHRDTTGKELRDLPVSAR